MIQNKKIFAVTGMALGLAGLFAFQNCSPTRFTGPNVEKALSGPNSSLGTPGITPPQLTTPCHDFTKVSVPLRVIVAIDNTGSTGSNQFATEIAPSGYSYVLGSDNDQAFRQRSVNEFVDSLATLSNITFNFQYFQDLAHVHWRHQENDPIAKSLINFGGDNQSPSFGTALDMKSALKQFLTYKADGATEYFTSLSLIRKAIQNDANFASGTQNYAVVFMSDGEPTERLKYNADGSIDRVLWDPKTDEPELLAAITNLVALSPGHISFSTIFFNNMTPQQRADQIAAEDPSQGPLYDPVDPLAPALLQEMANVGLGQFANANIKGADNIKLNNVITVPSAICPQ